MRWYDVAAYFFGGVLLANFVTHFVAGVSGRSFPTPFAKPPFVGLSSPTINVLWALGNLALAYALLVVVGELQLGRAAQVAISATGFGLAALGIARAAGKLPGGSAR